MIVTPIAPRALPASPLLNTTRSFYQVLDAPAPLAGMKYPSERSWPCIDLQVAGFTSVVCLTHGIPRYDPTPLHMLFAAGFQHHWPHEGSRISSGCREYRAAAMVATAELLEIAPLADLWRPPDA
jgi:hypothetical protein